MVQQGLKNLASCVSVLQTASNLYISHKIFSVNKQQKQKSVLNISKKVEDSKKSWGKFWKICQNLVLCIIFVFCLVLKLLWSSFLYSCICKFLEVPCFKLPFWGGGVDDLCSRRNAYGSCQETFVTFKKGFALHHELISCYLHINLLKQMSYCIFCRLK